VSWLSTYRLDYNKHVSHYLLICGINKLVGNRIIGNNDSSLGNVQDIKFAMENNLVKAPKLVEELVLA